MKIIKKITAILLCILCFSNFASAQTFVFPETSNEIKNAVGVYKAFGVLWDGFSEKSPLTRLELACFVSRAAHFGSGEGDFYGGAEELEDYSKNEKYSAAVYTAVEENIISTDGNRFNPDGFVTYAEFLRAFEAVLGYGNIADLTDNSAVMRIAAEHKLIENIRMANSSDYISDEKVCEIIFSDIDAEMCTLSDLSDKEYTTSDKTFAEHLGFSEATGILTAVGDNALFGSESVTDGSVAIDKTVYSCGENDYSEYIGYKVKYYTEIKSGSDNKLVYLYPYRTEVKEISADKLVRDKTTVFSVEYMNENNSEKSARLSSEVNVIYNDRTVFAYTLKHILPENGRIVLIDNNGDGRYDVVKTYDYYNVVVNNIGLEKAFVTDYYSGEVFSLDESKYDRLEIIKNDRIIKANAITKWNVLSVYKSEGDRPYAKVIVSDKAINGIVTRIDSEDGLTYMFISGEKYRCAYGYIPEMTAGYEGQFMLDSSGFISGCASEYSTKLSTGILLTAYMNESSDSTLVRMFTEDNTWAEFKISNRLTVCGKSYKPEVYMSLYGGLNGFNSLYSGSVVTYKVNTKGELVQLNTAEEQNTTDTDELQIMCSNAERRYSDYSHSFSVNAKYIDFYIDGKTKIFKCDGNKIADSDSYSRVTSVPFYGNKTYTVSAYKLSDENVADVIVYYSKPNEVDTNQSICIIDQTVTTVNDDGDTVSGVYVWSGGEKRLIVGKDENTFSEFSKGDAVIYDVDVSGRYADECKRYFSVNTEIPMKQGTDTTLNITEDFLTVYGRVSKVSGNFITVELPDNPSDMPKLLTYDISKAKVYFYDTKRDDITSVSTGDIDNDCKVFFRCSKTQVMDILAIK